MENQKDCCKGNRKEHKGILAGIAYGLIPHIGCIAFIVGAILGVSALMQFFKPVLMNRYFFHILVIVSLLFATLSSVLYLKRNGILSTAGAKRKWKYLTAMYGLTIGINLLLFLAIFPLLANASPLAGNSLVAGDESLLLKVNIPCPGHAPLISNELRAIEGVNSVQFSFPNKFNVNYDGSKTSKQDILSLDVFKTYRAAALSG